MHMHNICCFVCLLQVICHGQVHRYLGTVESQSQCKLCKLLSQHSVSRNSCHSHWQCKQWQALQLQLLCSLQPDIVRASAVQQHFQTAAAVHACCKRVGSCILGNVTHIYLESKAFANHWQLPKTETAV
jgi:hypothetical protein